MHLHSVFVGLTLRRFWATRTPDLLCHPLTCFPLLHLHDLQRAQAHYRLNGLQEQGQCLQLSPTLATLEHRIARLSLCTHQRQDYLVVVKLGAVHRVQALARTLVREQPLAVHVAGLARFRAKVRIKKTSQRKQRINHLGRHVRKPRKVRLEKLLSQVIGPAWIAEVTRQRAMIIVDFLLRGNLRSQNAILNQNDIRGQSMRAARAKKHSTHQHPLHVPRPRITRHNHLQEPLRRQSLPSRQNMIRQR